MTGTWGANRLLSLLLAYAVAAIVGPMMFASSQIILERLHPTSPIPGAQTYPQETNPSAPNGAQASERGRIAACVGLRDDVRRLHCFDTMVERR